MPIDPQIANHIAAYQIMKQMALKGLEGKLEAQHVTHCAGNSASNILWLAGHLAASLDGIASNMLGAAPVLPKSYEAKFGMGTKPSSNSADYPSLDELRRDLDAAATSVINALGCAPAGILEKPLPEGSPVSRIFPNVGVLLHAMVFHTGYHIGQISLLRSAQGLPTGFAM